MGTFDKPYDLCIEVFKFFRRNPKFIMHFRAHIFYAELLQVVCIHSKARDIARAVSRHIPFPGDLDGISLIHHRVEYRLLR